MIHIALLMSTLRTRIAGMWEVSACLFLYTRMDRQTYTYRQYTDSESAYVYFKAHLAVVEGIIPVCLQSIFNSGLGSSSGWKCSVHRY